MNTYPIEININIQRVEDLRIKLNGKEYALIPIVDNEEEEHRPDDAPTLAVLWSSSFRTCVAKAGCVRQKPIMERWPASRSSFKERISLSAP